MPTSPPPKAEPPGYGVVEYSDGSQKKRFACWGNLSAEAVAALCAVARQHGAQPTSTAGWLTKSRSNSEPKE